MSAAVSAPLARTGDLTIRVTLEAPIGTPDGAGGETVVWSEVARMWAALTPLSGSETHAFDRADPSVRWRVLIRHRGDVVPAMRFRSGGRVLEIRAAYDPDGRRQWIECLAEERGQ